MDTTLSRRMFLGGLLAMPLVAGNFWEKKGFPDWTEANIDKILTDSPWARPFTLAFNLEDSRGLKALGFSDLGIPAGIGFPSPGIGIPGRTGRQPQPGVGSPGGAGRGSPVRTEVYLTVRWSSALPVREALFLEQNGRKAGGSQDLAKMLNEPQDHYVIEIFGLPTQVVTMGSDHLAEKLRATASLTSPGRRAIRVETVDVPPYGEYLALTFRFPRTNAITLEDKDVEFSGSAGPFEFKQRFKLKSMVYRGDLAL